MAIRKLRVYPDPILHQISKPVRVFDDEFQQLVDDMKDTMCAANGIGISAIQVGVPLRVLIILDTHPLNPEVIVNPSIVDAHGMQEIREGCLSVPGVFEDRSRAETVTVSYLTRYGEHTTHIFSGVEAFCLQHEMDHLDGKVFVDELSSLKKTRVRGKINKTVKRLRRDPTTLGAY
jgi:peptide deformylase